MLLTFSGDVANFCGGKVWLAQFIAVTWLNADRLAHPNVL
jgi:hypothetical protein